MVRWCVPVFVMISGALFLSRDVPNFKVIYSKYVFRMVLAFITWSIFYALSDSLSGKDFFMTVIKGHYHMWFILMIAGLYMSLPFIKCVVMNDSNARYFIVISVLFSFLFPTLMRVVGDFGNEIVVNVFDILNVNVWYMGLNGVLEFPGFFVIGYYLEKICLNRKQRFLIYGLGLFGFVFTIGMNRVVALKMQANCENYFGNQMINVLFEAIAIFVFFKYNVNKPSERLYNVHKCLAESCFGIYLVHAWIITKCQIILGINTLMCNPIIAVPLMTAIVFCLSWFISFALNHIPFLKGCIV